MVTKRVTKHGTIKVQGIEDKPNKVVLKTSEGNFTVWKKAFESQEDSDAYKQFQQMVIGINSEIGLKWGEKPASFENAKGETVNYTDRSVYEFLLGGTPKIEDGEPF